MVTLHTWSVILAVVAFILLLIAIFTLNKRYNWIYEQYIDAMDDIEYRIESAKSPDAMYRVQMAYSDNEEYERYNGKWGVVRVMIENGRIHHTTIKIFTDDDNDFNKREAEELCAMLNAN